MMVKPILPVPMTPTVMVRSSRPILPFRVKSLSLVLYRAFLNLRMHMRMAITVYSATPLGA